MADGPTFVLDPPPPPRAAGGPPPAGAPGAPGAGPRGAAGGGGGAGAASPGRGVAPSVIVPMNATCPASTSVTNSLYFPFVITESQHPSPRFNRWPFSVNFAF